jgi:hypothetical protein
MQHRNTTVHHREDPQSPTKHSASHLSGAATSSSASVAVPQLAIPTESDASLGAFDPLLPSSPSTAEDAAKFKRREMLKRPSIRASLLSPRSSQAQLELRQAAANSASSSGLLSDQLPSSPRLPVTINLASSPIVITNTPTTATNAANGQQAASSQSSPRHERPRSHEITELSSVAEVPLSYVRHKEEAGHHTATTTISPNTSSPSLKHSASAKDAAKSKVRLLL